VTRPADDSDVTLPLTEPVRDPPNRRPLITPLSSATFKIQFTLSGEAHDKFRRVQDLMRHVVPSGDPATIFERAVTLLLRDLEHSRCGATDRPRAARVTATPSRRVPASIRRKVWARDGGRCAFIGTSGRCGEQGFLEYHHVVPFAVGGETTVENLQLRCRAHNQYESDLFFGPILVREERAAWLTTRSGPS
jgi:5-methylcytosine-specific restriction endonuclease McrA